MFLIYHYSKWVKMNVYSYIIFTTLLYFLVSIPIILLFVYFDLDSHDLGGIDFQKHSLLGLFTLTVIIAPIIETLIAQVVPIELFSIIFKTKNKVLPVLTSALFFALMHYGYSIWYSIIILPLGLLLANTYVIFKKRNESSFWVTTAIHALRNFVGIIVIFFTEY